MAAFAGLVQVFGGVPEFIDPPALDDVEHLEPDVAKRLDPRDPLDWVALNFAVI